MIKKLLTIMLAIVMAFGVVACGDNSGDYSDTTLILVDIDDGGLGTEWLERAATRFSELKKNESYAPGKTGVKILPTAVGVVNTVNAASSGTHIYVQPYVSNVKSIVNEGNVLEISDVVTAKSDTRNGTPISIEEKLGDYTGRYQGADGKYYAVPANSYFACLTYDIDNWEKYGLYFANQDAIDSGDCEEYECETLGETYYFVEEDSVDLDIRSCGPDGESGTSDDGLPSSMYEFIAVCEYMLSEKSINPLYCTGQFLSYHNFILDALMANLMGYDRLRTMYEFDGGEYEIVTGFYDEPLFPHAGDEAKNIKKPKTKVINLTEESGYYYSWAVEKYYAEAFMELAMIKGWFHIDSYDNSVSQKHAMQNFIFNGTGKIEKIGMLIENSFWYCESELSGFMDMYENQANNDENVLTKRLSVMALPINYSESVEEGEGRRQAAMETWKEMIFINKHRTENNPEMERACKEFVQYLCSDYELSKYTSEAYLFKAMDYEVSAEDYKNMDFFGKELLKFYETVDISYAYAKSATYNNNPGVFDGAYDNGYFIYQNYESYFAAKKADPSLTCHKIFCGQAVSKEGWSGIYGGTNPIVSGVAGDSINAIPSGKS
ncbi:MAG: hypothetical protein IKA85_00140 [Clostridia bacterium]|nr:hypothetical protein [Clostridia bacterium]